MVSANNLAQDCSTDITVLYVLAFARLRNWRMDVVCHIKRGCGIWRGSLPRK